MRIDQAKTLFLDRPKVMARVDRARRRNLMRSGGFIRTTARRSLRKRKGTSPPDGPPYSHAPHQLRDGILFGYDEQADSVLVGPFKFNGKVGNAPEALEKGGESETRVRRRTRTIIRRVMVRKRPYMVPALEAEQARAAERWRGTVK
jgi:hypothetical protein